MRLWFFVALLQLAAGCTNDYQSFRIPKGQTRFAAPDAGDGSALDGG